MRRSFTASGATSPPKQPSTAFALAMWWLAAEVVKYAIRTGLITLD